MKELKYLVTTNGYPSGSTWYYEPDPNTVSYVIQCVPGSTYTIRLIEAGNRLRVSTFTADPIKATGSLSGTSHLSINDPAVGYTYTVKPDNYGYLVFYLSNAGQYPEVSIVTDGAGGDDTQSYYCCEVPSGTSLTATMYAFTDNWVFASVTTRAAATYPAGWTLLHESAMTDAFPQKMAFLCKKATADEPVTLTVQQASATRLYINLIRFEDVLRFEYHPGTEHIFETDSGGRYAVNRPEYRKLVWGCSGYYWTTSSPYPLWTCEELGTAICIGKTTQSRQANFIDESEAVTRTFVSPATDIGVVIDCVEIVDHVVHYASEGTAEFTVTAMQQITSFSDAQLTWSEDTPESTAVNVYAKVDDGEYLRCTNGTAPPCLEQGEDYSESTLYIKAVLTTDDPSVTPAIYGIRLVIHDVTDANVIVLHFATGNLTSIQNAAGDITVAYAGGTLMGRGGPVLAFSRTFTPEDLIFKGHQNDTEHIEVDLSVSGELKRVDYINTRELEHIEVNISVEGQLINIKDI